MHIALANQYTLFIFNILMTCENFLKIGLLKLTNKPIHLETGFIKTENK